MELRLDYNSSYKGSSFCDLLRHNYPYILPSIISDPYSAQAVSTNIPHGTTIMALKYRDGIIMGGDRRATEGYQISSRKIEKIFRSDNLSLIGIAGAAGPCLELVRLFQTELEHYEKLEGTVLTLEGKANKLAQMVHQNLPAALHGLIVIPIFAGYDTIAGVGRIFKYDITGGRYEEEDYYATGSGGKDARNTVKKLFHPDMSQAEAISTILEALSDAAEEDIGTGGPDLIRDIFPTIKLVTSSGLQDVPSETIKSTYQRLLNSMKGKAG